jgi:hypothetical protein
MRSRAERRVRFVAHPVRTSAFFIAAWSVLVSVSDWLLNGRDSSLVGYLLASLFFGTILFVPMQWWAYRRAKRELGL